MRYAQLVELYILYFLGLGPAIWVEAVPSDGCRSTIENYFIIVLMVFGCFAGYEMRRKFIGIHHYFGFSIYIFWLSLILLFGMSSVIVRVTQCVDATPLVHDVKGNLTTNKNGQTYAWDIENRLQSATVPAGCPEGVTGTHTYTYDALGRRVSKTVGGNTTIFISDGMQEIAEYVNGAFSQSYVYGSYIDEPLLKIDNAGNKIYYHANNLFSIAALTDNAGTVVERYKYDPYGKATVLAADGVTVRTQSLHGNCITFAGRRIDDETGLMYYRTRTYDLNLGRFLNRMPWHAMGGKISKLSFLPLLLVLDYGEWSHLTEQILIQAKGSYIQNRYNLYDFVRNGPTMWIEPFSSASQYVYRPVKNGYEGIKESYGTWAEQVGSNAPVALQNASAAFRDASLTGLAGPHNGPQDAWRHCYWSCLMAMNIGARDAKLVGDAHEKYAPGPANEAAMDMHNNAEGRACAKSKMCGSDFRKLGCWDCCMKKLRDGGLQVISDWKEDGKKPAGASTANDVEGGIDAEGEKVTSDTSFPSKK